MDTYRSVFQNIFPFGEIVLPVKRILELFKLEIKRNTPNWVGITMENTDKHNHMRQEKIYILSLAN